MIAENINHIRQEIGQNVKLVVVSKFRRVEEIEEAYKCGHRIFAENKVQALLERYEALPKDIEWHLIGHLQTNKVKYIAPFIHTIQSVDSLKLLQEINKHAQRQNRVIDCLLQIYIAKEETKFGLDAQECHDILNSGILKTLQNIRIAGLMGMATFTDDMTQVETEFRYLKKIFDDMKSKYNLPGFKTLSMGMSNDYILAVSCGSNMIRVGSKIFV